MALYDILVFGGPIKCFPSHVANDLLIVNVPASNFDSLCQLE